MALTPSDTLDLVKMYQPMIRYGDEILFLQLMRHKVWELRATNDHSCQQGVFQ